MGDIFFGLALNVLTLELERFLFRNLRPLDWILSFMVSIPLELGQGATAAANNELPDRLLNWENQGRWRSDKAKDVYCRDDIEHQLLVTLNIGIKYFHDVALAPACFVCLDDCFRLPPLIIVLFCLFILITEMFPIRLNAAIENRKLG